MDNQNNKKFAFTSDTAVLISEYAVPYESNPPIYICKGLKVDIKEIWLRVKVYI